MNTRRVAITGMGLISPLSLSLDGFWDALISSRGAIGPYFLEGGSPAPISVAAPALFSGAIDEFDAQDNGQKKAIKKAMKVMSREIQMAVAAANRALNHADVHIGQFPADRVGISFGSDYILTTVEDVIDGIRSCCRNAADGKTFEFSRWATDGLPKMSPLWQLKYLPNMPSSHIAILNDFHGPSNSITLREASIGASIGESVATIRSGRTDIMLVGTTGSRLHPVKLVDALQQEEIATDFCRPFDRERSGTVLGDGAAALVLEEWEHARRRGVTIWGEVLAGSYRTRYTPHSDEAAKSEQCRALVGSVLRDILRRGGMEAEKIGHVNAHGLGNRRMDRAESQAIDDVFGKRNRPIPLVAAKGYFGNIGAGAGAVELIASVLALHHGVLFPTLHFNTPDPDCPVHPTRDAETPGGDSFVKIAMNHQNQASAVLVRKAEN